MVDTGAIKSAIFARVMEGSKLSLRPERRKWRSVDGPGRGILGEVGLTVKYEDTHVRLSEVIVFENQQIPLMLGKEQIEAANVSVAVENFQGTVTLLWPKEIGDVEGGETEVIRETSSGEGMSTKVEEEIEVKQYEDNVLKVLSAGKATLPKIMEDPDEIVEPEGVSQPSKAMDHKAKKMNPQESDTTLDWKG